VSSNSAGGRTLALAFAKLMAADCTISKSTNDFEFRAQDEGGANIRAMIE
jgi:hypothetical protein